LAFVGVGGFAGVSIGLAGPVSFGVGGSGGGAAAGGGDDGRDGGA
jgi:hypothetical protein